MKLVVFFLAWSLIFLNTLAAQLPFHIDASSHNGFALYDINVDSVGNRIIVGSLLPTSLHDFDPSNGEFSLTSPQGGVTGFVASYNRSGTLNYAFHISDTDITPQVRNYLVESDLDGNIYVFGALIGKADFDPGPNVSELSAASVFQSISFLASYNQNGNFRFALPLPLLDNFQAVNVFSNNFINKILAVDDSGNSYLLLHPAFTGTYDLDPGPGQFIISNDMHVASYDRNGQFRFAYPAPANTKDIGANTMGDHFIIGTLNESTDQEFDFDPSPAVVQLPDVTNSSFFFAAYTSAGALTFVHDIKGPNALPIVITGTASDDIVIVGKMSGIIDFDPGNEEFNVEVSEFEPDLGGDIFLAQYDNSGNLQMAVAIQDQPGNICNEAISDMEVDTDGNIYITGNLQYGAVDFDPSSGILNVNGGTSSSVLDDGYDLFAASFSPSGQVRFAYAVEDSRIAYSSMDIERACANYVLSGTVSLHVSPDLDPGPGQYVVQPGSGANIYVVPLNTANLAAPGDCSATTDVLEIDSGFNLRLYPNPAQEYIHISGSQESAFARVQIIDALGKTVLETWLGESGFVSVECAGFKPGIYCVSLWEGHFRESAFFVKN